MATPKSFERVKTVPQNETLNASMHASLARITNRKIAARNAAGNVSEAKSQTTPPAPKKLTFGQLVRESVTSSAPAKFDEEAEAARRLKIASGASNKPQAPMSAADRARQAVSAMKKMNAR